MKNIPVYLFTVFREAGKTRFIQDTMEDPEFNAGEKTLILLCEEGEEELNLSRFVNGGSSIVCHTVEKEDWFTEDRLEALRRRADAERVMIEYNGMWQLDALYQNLPPHWNVAQELFIADSNTILSYNANMRQQVVDKLQSASVALFNRVSDATDKMALHKLVRGVSRRTQIAYENVSHQIEVDTIEDPLPFDVNADTIVIEDRDYALFYRDISEEMHKYNEKIVTFLGVVAKAKGMGKGEFALGRHVMVCCEADIAYRAFLAKYPQANQLESYDWVKVTAQIEVKKTAFYNGEGPVLKILKLEKAEKPIEEVATFY